MDYKQAKTLKEKLLKGEPIVEELDRDLLDKDEEDDELEMECFRAGTHIDSQGVEETYTTEDLEKIATQYNAQAEVRPAPLIIGHSSMEAGKDDTAPAFGWAKEAKVEGDSLILKFERVDPQMRNMIKSGAYRNRSISLYGDGRIRHVAALGAMQPALELKPVSFSDGEKYKTYEYKELDMANEVKKVEELEQENSFFKKLFNLFKIEVKDYAQAKDPNASIMAMEKGAPGEEATESKALSEDANKETIAEEQSGEGVDSKLEIDKKVKAEEVTAANAISEENAALKRQVSELEAKVKSLEGLLVSKTEEMVEDGAKSFCEALIKEGKLRPADLDATLTTFQQKAYIDSVRNYAEQGLPTATEQYKLQLTNAPKVVEFAEIVPKSDLAVSVPSLHSMAEEKAKKDGCDYMAAYKKTMEENPDHEEVKAMCQYMQMVRDSK